MRFEEQIFDGISRKLGRELLNAAEFLMGFSLTTVYQRGETASEELLRIQFLNENSYDQSNNRSFHFRALLKDLDKPAFER